MQNINNFNLTEELWLECEKIKESVSLVLEKLQQLSNSQSDADFSSLIEDIAQQLTAQTSSLEQSLTSALNSSNTALTQSISLLLDSQTTTLQTALNSLNSNVTTNGTNISLVSQNVTALISALAEAQSAILRAISEISSSGGSSEPFDLDFDEVYATSSTYYSPRTHYSTSDNFILPKEPFVIDINSPAYILAEFDLTLDSAQDVELSFYINTTSVHTKTLSLGTGSTHIIQQFALNNLTQSDNKVFCEIITTQTCTKTVENLQYTLVGNNALFLREMPQNVYTCWPVNEQIYLTKRNKNVGEYKVLNMSNLDFSGNYSTVATLAQESTIFPILVLTCSSSGATVNQLGYVQINEVTGKLTTHNADDSQQRSLDLAYSTEFPQEVNVFPYYDGTYTGQIVLIYSNQNRLRRYRLYNTLRSSTLTQNFSNDLVPIQMQFPNVCTIKKGFVSGYSDYVLYQNSQGKWYANTITKLGQGTSGFALGFGTRASFSICPPLSQNSNDNYVYMRAFIKSYSRWRAYYFYVNKSDGSFALQKVEEITVDYDQIIGANANLYFAIKNGSITPFYDQTFKSITEF